MRTRLYQACKVHSSICFFIRPDVTHSYKSKQQSRKLRASELQYAFWVKRRPHKLQSTIKDWLLAGTTMHAFP